MTSSYWLRDDRHSLVIAALVWALIVLVIAPEGFDYSHFPTVEAPTSGAPLTRLLWLSMLGLGILAAFWRPALSWLLLRELNPFILAFLALAVASAAWSIEPSLTLRRDLRLITFVMVSMGFVLNGWHGQRFQRVLRPILTIMLGGSILFGLIYPQYAIHQESNAELVGAWRGLTTHKNGLGALSCIGFIFWFHAWLVKDAPWFKALFGGALALACLLLSRSSTSIVATILVAVFLLMFLRSPRSWRPYMPFAVGLFVLVLLAYSLAILQLVPGLDLLLTPIVAFTGKDLSFTGRRDIWALVVEHIDLHPYLGTGYGAYWSPIPGSPSLDFLTRMYFYPGSAHNGYLDIVNDLGVLGLVLLIGYLINYVRQSLRMLVVNREQSALYLALFLQQGITNLSETHWLCVTSVDCVLMTLATASLARAHLECHLHRYFGVPDLRAAASVSPFIGLRPAEITAQGNEFGT